MSSYQPIVPNTRIPVTPIVTVQGAPPVQSGSQERQSAFDAHLQHAHRHHAQASSRTDDADQADDGQADTASADKASVASASANASSSPNGTKANADKVSDTDGSKTSTLVRSVLGLIGQSPEETDGSAAPTTAKDEPNKPLVALGEKPDAAPAPLASMLLAAPAANTNVLADTGTGDALLSSVKSAGAANLFAGLGDASDATDADSSGATDDSAAGDSFAVPGASLPALNPASLGQDAIGTIFGSGHATHGADAGTAAGDATPAIRDMGALNGLLGTQGVGPSMGALPTTAHNLTVNAPVDSPSFSSELVQQVAWLGGQDIKQAKILLHPQDLGQLNVNVSIAHGKVDVVFLAQHPNAVAAVQQSLGQLSQMLNSQGLSLGQATVGQQSAQQNANGSSSGNAARGNADDDGIADVAMTPVTQRLALGLVDAFA